MQVVGRLADKPPKAGMPLAGLLVRQGLRDTLLHADDLATFTKLRTGAICQTQSLLLARPWMQVGSALPLQCCTGAAHVSVCPAVHCLHLKQVRLALELC